MSVYANSPSSSSRQINFGNMSVALTGFTADVVTPLFDPLDLVAQYLRTADTYAGSAAVDSLIQQYLSLSGAGLGNQQIADTLLETSNPKPGPEALLAARILTLWYLGSWYSAPAPRQPSSPTVISANAYIGGLAWKAMQAHPMGSSDFTFGYWVQSPPSLSDFGVDLPTAGEKNA